MNQFEQISVLNYLIPPSDWNNNNNNNITTKKKKNLTILSMTGKPWTNPTLYLRYFNPTLYLMDLY